jgi:hypothetical protein
MFAPQLEPHSTNGAHGSQRSDPFATLDLDDATLPGLETITVWTRVKGVYRYRVHNYSNEQPLTDSGARVSIYNAGGLLEQYEVPTTGTGRFWTVFELNGESGELTDINTLGQ